MFMLMKIMTVLIIAATLFIGYDILTRPLPIQRVHHHFNSHIHQLRLLYLNMTDTPMNASNGTQVTYLDEIITGGGEPKYIVTLVVPLRDRANHLERLIAHMRAYMQNRDFKMIINCMHQINSGFFNRARLFNNGLKLGNISQSRCIVVHDVDMMPQHTVNYTECTMPTQFSSEIDAYGWSMPYPESAGGVFAATYEHWMSINGMSNEFVGWGGEDDELFQRLKVKQLLHPITGLPTRPSKGRGGYTTMNDANHTLRIRSPFYDSMVQHIQLTGSGQTDLSADGVSTNTDQLEIGPMQRVSENLEIRDIRVIW